MWNWPRSSCLISIGPRGLARSPLTACCLEDGFLKSEEPRGTTETLLTTDALWWKYENYWNWKMDESGMSNCLGYYTYKCWGHEEFGGNLAQSTIQCFFVSNFSRNPPVRLASHLISHSGTRNELVELTLARRHEWLFLIHDSSSPEPHKGCAASHSWFIDRNDGVSDSCGSVPMCGLDNET